jgi:hypothetical protein
MWIDPWGLATVLHAQSRGQALSMAQNFAGVPRNGRGGVDIPLDDLRENSRGKNWGGMKQAGGKKMGRMCSIDGDKRKWAGHPDGHPDMPADSHHHFGHVHAFNSSGDEVIFTYGSQLF